MRRSYRSTLKFEAVPVEHRWRSVSSVFVEASMMHSGLKRTFASQIRSRTDRQNATLGTLDREYYNPEPDAQISRLLMS